MAKNWKLIHIKSKQRGDDKVSPKLPAPEILEYGELAINFGEGIETLAIKNEKDEIVKFVSEKAMQKYVDKAIEKAVPVILRQIEDKIGELFNPSDESGATSIDSGEY